MNTNITDIISQTFKTHLFIEFYYKHDKGLFLLETVNYNTPKSVILEQYGVFNGCEETAKDIINEINKSDGINPINIKVNNLTWLRNINLEFTNLNIEAAYIPSETVLKNNIFETITIVLNLRNVKSYDTFPILMHELTHVYQDYQLRMKGLSLEGELKKEGYGKNQPKYSDDFSISDNRKRDLAYNLSWILYHLNDFERSGYISQIKGYLENTKKRFNTVEDVFNFLKETVTYNNYETVFEWSKELLTLNNKELTDFILSYVKGLSNLQFNDYKEFKHWLRSKLDRYNRKFNCILPKIAYEYIKTTRGTLPHVTKSIRK